LSALARACAATGVSRDTVNLFFMVFLTAWILFVPLNARLHLRPYGTPDAVTELLRRVEERVEPRTAPAPDPAPSAFEQESAMGPSQLMKRWDPVIAEAARKVGIPEKYVRAVMRMESGGRTMLAENRPIKSSAGAIGLMQLMPRTYAEMRAQLGLGADAFNPHDNVLAGAAYLRQLYKRYGYPAMFAAYNAGPGYLEDHLYRGRALPDETKHYVKGVAGFLGDKNASDEPAKVKTGSAGYAELTRADGSTVRIDKALVRSVRKPLPNEYAANVQAVITVGRTRYGVLETVADAMKLALG
jgi:hypothetical protein